MLDAKDVNSTYVQVSTWNAHRDRLRTKTPFAVDLPKLQQ